MDQNSTNSDLHRLAINAALNCQWEEAVRLNQQINEADPINITTLNRLARALCELGKYKEAKKIYHDVLSLDPYNSIAQKNLKKIQACKDNDPTRIAGTVSMRSFSSTMFLKEPGITKLVNLIKLAEPQKLMSISAGTMVELVPKTKNITVVDQDDHYLGVLPDDTAFLLLKLIHGGNKYQAIIRSVKSNAVTIMIRETFRAKRFKNQPSFLDETNIVSMPSDNLSLIGDVSESDRSDDEADESSN